MKPLARWTIGPVSYIGEQILEESVRRFEKIYPEFDRVVCCNHFRTLPSFFSKLNAEIYIQKNSDLEYSLSEPDANPSGAGMKGSGWKLCPPRLRLEAPELWLDNDVVILDRIPKLDAWLKNPNGGLVSEGVHRLYGIYSQFIPEVKCCAGVFSLPPNFDFNAKILSFCRHLNGLSLGHYDEQGLVVAILHELGCQIIPLNEIANCGHKLPTPLTSGLHFVGANRTKNHASWNAYKRKKIL